MTWSPTLFSGYVPVGLPPVLWTEKKLKFRNFSSDVEIIAAAVAWLDGQISVIFLSVLQKLEQQTKKRSEFRGENIK